MQHRWYYTICLMTVLGLLNGCHWDPYLGDYTRNKVQVKDLIGTWVPDKNTKEDMISRGGYKKRLCQIVLRSNNTYSMVNMPDWVFDDSGQSHGKFKSGTGHWKFHQSTGRSDYAYMYFPHPDCGAILRSQAPPYKLNFTLGDPDEGDAAVFIKLSN